MISILVVGTISLTILLSVLTLVSHSANASILGSLGQGWYAGKEAALRSLNSGQSYNASCPSEMGISYCVGYHSGYFEEWSSQRGANHMTTTTKHDR
jgi:hypothetical protein